MNWTKAADQLRVNRVNDRKAMAGMGLIAILDSPPSLPMEDWWDVDSAGSAC